MTELIQIEIYMLGSLKIVFKAIGAGWIRLPGSVLSICLFASAAAKSFGFHWVPELEIKTLVHLGLLVVFIWFVLALGIAIVKQDKRITVLNSAYDRTDKHLVSLGVAISHIADADSSYSALNISIKTHKACVKLRSLALENQIFFWGRKIQIDWDDQSEVADEHYIMVSPVLFKNSMIDEATIYLEAPDMRCRTKVDPKYSLEVQVPDLYCDLKVSRHTLEAMFPRDA